MLLSIEKLMQLWWALWKTPLRYCSKLLQILNYSLILRIFLIYCVKNSKKNVEAFCVTVIYLYDKFLL